MLNTVQLLPCIIGCVDSTPILTLHCSCEPEMWLGHI